MNTALEVINTLREKFEAEEDHSIYIASTISHSISVNVYAHRKDIVVILDYSTDQDDNIVTYLHFDTVYNAVSIALSIAAANKIVSIVTDDDHNDDYHLYNEE